MSSYGELFITEELRDIIELDMRKRLKHNDWSLKPDKYTEVWERAEIYSGEVEVVDDDNKVLGTVSFVIEPYVEEDLVGRLIEIRVTEYTIKLNGWKRHIHTVVENE